MLALLVLAVGVGLLIGLAGPGQYLLRRPNGRLLMVQATLLAAVALSLLPLCVAAQSTVPVTGREALEIGTSTTEIMIAFGFRGTEITIFGAILGYDQNLLQQKRYNLVVALEGPKRNLTVCKNERVLGVWINTKSVDFSAVLSVYSLSTTDGWLILDSIGVSPA
nr:TIGR02186 family protein [Rhizobium ruizarguesonis]